VTACESVASVKTRSCVGVVGPWTEFGDALRRRGQHCLLLGHSVLEAWHRASKGTGRGSKLVFHRESASFELPNHRPEERPLGRRQILLTLYRVLSVLGIFLLLFSATPLALDLKRPILLDGATFVNDDTRRSYKFLEVVRH